MEFSSQKVERKILPPSRFLDNRRVAALVDIAKTKKDSDFSSSLLDLNLLDIESKKKILLITTTKPKSL